MQKLKNLKPVNLPEKQQEKSKQIEIFVTHKITQKNDGVNRLVKVTRKTKIDNIIFEETFYIPFTPDLDLTFPFNLFNQILKLWQKK